VGLTETRIVDLPGPVRLRSGAVLPSVRVAYETYGRLDEERGNAILICHALSGDAHAAGYHANASKPGWWESAIGPGKGFDTEKHFIICSNVLGGCQGTTGPSSIDPETGKPYGIGFPVVTIQDMVLVQRLLIDHLGIKKLAAVAGGSMGGMQALQWAVSYPEMVQRLVVIASTAVSTPQQIAFSTVGRKAITSDPEWNGGDYYAGESPSFGLSIARMIGHITYLSDDSMRQKFGRSLQGKQKVGYDLSTDFQVESYLHHQGESFVRRFDPNSYLYITKAIDYFDLSKHGSLSAGLASVKAKTLVVGISSDWLYPPYQSQDIVTALSANGTEARYAEIRSNYGHDAFLLEEGQLNYILKDFFGTVKVQDIMEREFHTITTSASIADAANAMLRYEINHLPVVDENDQLVGIVTSWDIAKAVARGIDDLRRIVSFPVITARGEERIGTAVRRMEGARISAMPVVDDAGCVLGIITNECLAPLLGRCR
jgi:homoserine O-acetyltransferase